MWFRSRRFGTQLALFTMPFIQVQWGSGHADLAHNWHCRQCQLCNTMPIMQGQWGSGHADFTANYAIQCQLFKGNGVQVTQICYDFKKTWYWSPGFTMWPVLEHLILHSQYLTLPPNWWHTCLLISIHVSKGIITTEIRSNHRLTLDKNRDPKTQRSPFVGSLINALETLGPS